MSKIATVIGTLIGYLIIFLGVILLIAFFAALPALIVAGLWMLAGPALASATGVAALGTFGFWPTFALAWIVMFLLGCIFRRSSATAKVEQTRSRY